MATKTTTSLPKKIHNLQLYLLRKLRISPRKDYNTALLDLLEHILAHSLNGRVCFKFQSTLADFFGVTRRTIINRLDSLYNHGLLFSLPCDFTAGNEYHLTNKFYSLLDSLDTNAPHEVSPENDELSLAIKEDIKSSLGVLNPPPQKAATVIPYSDKNECLEVEEEITLRGRDPEPTKEMVEEFRGEFPYAHEGETIRAYDKAVEHVLGKGSPLMGGTMVHSPHGYLKHFREGHSNFVHVVKAMIINGHFDLKEYAHSPPKRPERPAIAETDYSYLKGMNWVSEKIKGILGMNKKSAPPSG